MVCAMLQEQLNMMLKDMEEHSNHLARNAEYIVQSVKIISQGIKTDICKAIFCTFDE